MFGFGDPEQLRGRRFYPYAHQGARAARCKTTQLPVGLRPTFSAHAALLSGRTGRFGLGKCLHRAHPCGRRRISARKRLSTGHDDVRRTAPEASEDAARQLLQRGVEGVISIDASLPKSLALPVVFIDLPASDLPEPVTPLKRERLLAMGEAAVHSLIVQIERKTGHLTRVTLSPEPAVELVPHGIGAAVSRINAMEHFAD
jgi:hypothetical protein